MTKAERRHAQMEQLAKQLVSAKAETPGILGHPLMAPALAIWNDRAPELRRTGRLQSAHEDAFAMYCLYAAEFWAMSLEVLEHGHTQRVKTTVGGYMNRLSPQAHLRDNAMRMALQLGDRFGLTPTEEYKLFKDQQIVRRENPGLFGDAPAPGAPQAPPLAESTAELPLDGVGGMRGLRSEPPTIQ